MQDLKIRLLPDKNIQEDVSNLLSIKELKQFFLEKLGDKAEGLELAKLRFFCLGKELSDDLFVYSYDL